MDHIYILSPMGDITGGNLGYIYIYIYLGVGVALLRGTFNLFCLGGQLAGAKSTCQTNNLFIFVWV